MAEEFNTYEEALEAAADLKVEISDVFKPQASRQKKIFEGLFKDRKNKDLTFARDMILYQAGYPDEDSIARISKFRDQLAGFIEIYEALGLLDNANLFFAEVGIGVELNAASTPYSERFAEIPDKIRTVWDNEFFGEEIPFQGSEILSKVVNNAKTTQFDVNALTREIDEIAEDVEIKFGVKKGAFKKAVEMKFAEKTGKSVEEKIEKIEEGRKALDKALAPFIGEEDEQG